MRTIIDHYWKNKTNAIFYLNGGNDDGLDIGNSNKALDLTTLFNQTIFEDNLAWCAFYAKANNIESRTLRESIIEIIEILEQELKTL